jgi:hypothetical protein
MFNADEVTSVVDLVKLECLKGKIVSLSYAIKLTIVKLPRPNLRRSVTDLPDSSDRGDWIGFAKRIVHPFIDNRARLLPQLQRAPRLLQYQCLPRSI